MDWEVAILRCIDARGGTAHCQDIYRNIGSFINLTTEHLRATILADVQRISTKYAVTFQTLHRQAH